MIHALIELEALTPLSEIEAVNLWVMTNPALRMYWVIRTPRDLSWLTGYQYNPINSDTEMMSISGEIELRDGTIYTRVIQEGRERWQKRHE